MATEQAQPNLTVPGNPLRAIRNMDYVIVFARDMAAMRHFYADVMVFPVYRDVHPSWIEYRVGGSLLARAEVDACAEAFRKAGIKIVGEPTDQPWGHRTLFVRDPDGNVVEIYADL